jgi:hypothetical protein
MSIDQHETDLEADAARNGQLKTPVEARQAVKTHHVRWMLAISLTLGVVALGGAYVWYSTLQPHSPAAAVAAQPTSNG